jgi:hypothetical protein
VVVSLPSASEKPESSYSYFEPKRLAGLALRATEARKKKKKIF